MRIIITGGTGLIGAALSASLAGDGHEVIVLTRSPEAVARSLPVGVRAIGWDAHTAEGWGHFTNGADAIINLAGESIAGTGRMPSRWTNERKHRIYESRIDAGLAVVEAIEKAAEKPAVVIQASAVGYYGPRGDEIITEETGPGNDFLSSVAIAWEESTAPVEAMGVRRAIIRTGIVLSMAGGALPFSVLQFRTFTGGRLGNGRQWMPWIHIKDEVSAIRFLLDHPTASGPFNLSAPNPVTNAEFSEILAQVMGRPSFIAVPERIMRVALGEIATLVLDGQRAVPQRLLDLGFEFKYPDLMDALHSLL